MKSSYLSNLPIHSDLPNLPVYSNCTQTIHNHILKHPGVMLVNYIKIKFCHSQLSFKNTYSRQYVFVLLEPSSGLTSIMSRAKVVFTIIITTYDLL
jgi:hypothetical protein